MATRDFGGVSAKFTLVGRPQGGDFIIVQFANNTARRAATVLLKAAGGQLVAERLAPGAAFTRRLDSEALQVLYQPAGPPPTRPPLTDFVKDKVRACVTHPRGELKVESFATAGGVRG